MGVYYFYINDTKQQYFCIDPTNLDIKQYALGRNIGSRAFSYLILENDSNYTGVEAHPLVGSWIGDRFYVTGDDYCQRFAEITAEYADIGQAVIEMLVMQDPFNLLHYGGVDWFIHFIEHAGEPVAITAAMRKRISHALRHSLFRHPNEDLQRILNTLRREQQKWHRGQDGISAE